MTTTNPTIVSQETLDQAFDSGVRIGRLIHIQSALLDIGSPSQDFVDFFEYGEDVQIISDIDSDPIQSFDYEDCEGMAEYMSDRPEPFLAMIQYQIPICTRASEKYENSSWQTSWGYYKSKWVLAESIETALSFGITESNKLFVSSWEEARAEKSSQAGAQ